MAPQNTRRVVLTALVLAIAALPACTNALGGVREAALDHEHQEMTVSGEEIMADWRAEGDWMVSPVLEAADGATRAGALLGLRDVGVALPEVEARVLEGGVPVGDWQPLLVTWNEEDQVVAIADLGGLGDGAELRVRTATAPGISLMLWTAIIPDAATFDDAAPVEVADGVVTAELRSELSGLGIVSREEWGARATRCTSRDSSRTRFAIHHTVTGSANPETQVRGIQRFHMDTRGWCDVGYHFLIGSDGRIFEARPLHLLGAHVANGNTGNVGISFVGCFHTSGCSGLGSATPSNAAIESAGRLLGTLSRLYGITLDRTHVRGHREHAGASTSCPGNNLFSRVGNLVDIGRARTLGSSTPAPAPAPSPSPSPSPTPGASCTHTYGGTYASGACSASYQCCSGTWRERTSGCGACTCTETTGRTGCSGAAAPAAPTPPAGASCTHTYGGRYANTACSASYQCCDGRWRERTSGCGACFCTETSGSTGCGT